MQLPRRTPTGADTRRSTSAGFLRGFDGLRAIAALLVVVDHVGSTTGATYRHPVGHYLARGDIGVSVFFLISGFLLYRPFVAARFAGRSAPATGRFLFRRALRIVPLYWVALAATYVFGVTGPVRGVSGVVEHALFLQVYSSQWVLHGLLQAWTLCIEVTFYLAIPLWAMLLRHRDARSGAAPEPRRVLRRELSALAVLYVFGLLFRLWVGVTHIGATQTARDWLPAWSDHFALGMGLAVVSAYVVQTEARPVFVRLLERRGADLACWVGAAVAFWVVSRPLGLPILPLAQPPTDRDLARQVLFGIFALLLLLPAVFGPPRQGLVRRLLASRVFALLGLISYGIYLWHELFILLLLRYVHGWNPIDAPFFPMLVLAVALTLAISALTYVLVERPFVALGHRRVLRTREHAAMAGDSAPRTPVLDEIR